MKYTDVAWDLDGTLINSYPSLVRIYQDMMRQLGYPVTREEIWDKMTTSIGYAHKYYAERYGIGIEILECRFTELQDVNDLCVGEVELYPGIRKVLKAVKESGRRNHLYTNRNRRALRYLEQFDILQYFDGLVTSENIRQLKPAPDGLYVLFEQYGIRPEKLLMVGDRAVDVKAAKAAGADACFFNTNGIAVPEHADFAVEEIEELLEYL